MNKSVKNDRETSLLSRLGRNIFVHLFLITALVIIVYSNTLSVPFQFDDIQNIATSPEIKSFGSSIKRSRYIGDLTFSLNYWLNGLDVTGYHIINIIIHILNSLLVYSLVTLIFKTPALESLSFKDKSRYFSLSAALLFACHPVQTQAVTYIVQRFTSLATLFYLLSLVSYLLFRLKTSVPVRIAGYALAIMSAVLAMKTKEFSFTLPLAIALSELMFFRGSYIKRIANLTPLLITLLIIPVTLLTLGVSQGELLQAVEKVTRLQTDIPRSEYLFTQFRVIVTYVRLLFLPVGQNVDYDYPLYTSPIDHEVLISFLFLASIFATGAYCLFRLARKNPAGRLISFGIFWFFLTLSVESSFIPIADVIFEHRPYLSSVGIFISIPVGIYLFADIRMRRSFVYIVGVTIILLSTATFARNSVWQSKITLWEDVAMKSPQKARVHNNLGDAYHSNDFLDKAIKQYEITIQLDSDHVLAYKNLSSIYAGKGLMDKSKEYFNAILRINPEYEDAYIEMGNAYKEKGVLDKAIEYYSIAVKLKPDYAGAQYNLGLSYYENNQYKEAERHLLRASSLDPSVSETFHVLGNIYKSTGLTEKAVEYYEKALALNPDNADVNYSLGVIFGPQGKLDMAIKHFEAALELNPSIPGAHQNLGNAYAMSGQPFKAIEHFQLALKQDPDNAEVHYNLSEVYRSTGINRKADEHRIRALRLNPDLATPK
jgi:tetratricopeptide (TPR) repeat protein